MRTWNDLTAAEQQHAVDIETDSLLRAVTADAIRFDDEETGDDLQAAIDRGRARAEALQTPWFAHEYIAAEQLAHPYFTGGPTPTVLEALQGMAQCRCEDAFFPDPDEYVIHL